MKQTSARSILILVEALLLLAVLCVAPFAWILRDGLGPESVQSTGSAALGKAFMTFYAGPGILLLAAVRLLLGASIRTKQPDKRKQRIDCRLAAVVILFSALTLLIGGVLMK